METLNFILKCFPCNEFFGAKISGQYQANRGGKTEEEEMGCWEEGRCYRDNDGRRIEAFTDGQSWGWFR